MGQKPQILVDTDILIKVYRGNILHKKSFIKEADNLAISVVTYLELLFGLRTRTRIIQLNKQIKAYQMVHISEEISMKAMEIANKYSSVKSIKIADSFIAVTAIINRLRLFTDNKRDFEFISGIRFY